MLYISDLSVSIADQKILKGVNLTINPGTIHAVMGPNGSGKSTLAYTLMGHPCYQISTGAIVFDGQPINSIAPDKRARLGVFLAFQQPYAIPGVTIFAFLKEAHQAVTGLVMPVKEFQGILELALKAVGLDSGWADRPVNDGFSGGERKRLEMAQMLILKPKLIILDEIDSGLDVDGLSSVAACIAQLKKENPALSVICITHYQRILDYLVPDYVHIMHDGVIVSSGGAAVAQRVEKSGYAGFVSHE